ncbi:hypothetical protein GIB67_020851 [Kingdonia uniflora]|uniref:Uncharacterized protein n=1 Tax=Kingdonia uniflora TaxID=39325 RepID=A0A7J7M7P2_9MAGN|nr:hypothetical protein GIB67_020851 [Kingdonia uniflora]
MEVDKFGEDLSKDPAKSLPSLLLTINSLFSKLEASVGELNTIHQSESFGCTDGNNSCHLQFDGFWVEEVVLRFWEPVVGLVEVFVVVVVVVAVVVVMWYKKEVVYPIQNLLGGELVHELLIQIQKLKLDTETVMLELNQILKANKINFAMLAALPAFFLSFILLMFVRTWLKGDKRAQGKGRLSRLHRRLLVIEIEERIMQFQTFLDRGLVDNAQCMFGLVFYNLDRLYRAVERHAKAIGELPSLRPDIINLGKPRLQTAYKLTVTSRMQHATRDSPPTDGVRGRNCIMKDMYGGTVAYESILLSGVAPEEFYRVIIDEVIRDDVQLFMEGGYSR